MTARSTPAQYPRGAANRTFLGPGTGAAASTSSGERRRRGTVGIERETAEEVIAPCYRLDGRLPCEPSLTVAGPLSALSACGQGLRQPSTADLPPLRPRRSAPRPAPRTRNRTPKPQRTPA